VLLYSQFDYLSHLLFSTTGLHIAAGHLFQLGIRMGVFLSTANCKYKHEAPIEYFSDWNAHFITTSVNMQSDFRALASH
jgi:hypothetical protein